MYKITKTSLYEEIDELNRRYNLNDKTCFQFRLRTGYRGYKIILKMNMPYGTLETSITDGYLSPKECLNNLYQKFYDHQLDCEIAYFSKWAERFCRR